MTSKEATIFVNERCCCYYIVVDEIKKNIDCHKAPGPCNYVFEIEKES